MSDSRQAPPLHWLLVGIAAAAVYLNSLGGGYVFDDRWVIVENPIVQRSSLAEIFTSVYTPGPVYRPVTLLSFAINERLGWNPLADHVLNVALHVAVTLLVFALAGRVVRSAAARLLAALLFAVHPIHTEAVANLVGRAELLAALFALGAIVAFARNIEAAERGLGWLAVSLACFAIGPFAKESALTILPVIVLLHWYLSPETPWRRRLWIPAAYGLAALPYIAARLLFTGALTYPDTFLPTDNPLAYVAPHQRVATAAFIAVEYVGLLLAPITLSADYSYDQIPAIASAADPRLWMAALAAAVAAAALWKVRRRQPALVFAAAFAVCTLSLTANLAFPIGTIKAERLLYLPSVGWCIGAGAAAAWAMRRWRGAAVALATTLLVLYGARTWTRNYDWRDDASLYRATAAAVPNSAKAQYNFGTVLLDAGDLDAASVQFRRALEIDPTFWRAAFGIGKVYEAKEIPAGALHWYARTLSIDWNTPKAHLQTGLIRHQLGELAAAEAAYRTGLSILPNDPFLLLSLSWVRVEQGDSWEARELVRAYDRLAWTQPRYRAAYEESRQAILEALSS
jgi:protein O-mannosyl-transferase